MDAITVLGREWSKVHFSGVTMNSGSNILFSETVIALIVDRRHDEAFSFIEKLGRQIDVNQEKRLSGLVRIDRDKPEGIAEIGEAMRRALRENRSWLAYAYKLGVELMDIEDWAEAEVVLDEVIALSVAKDHVYFLDDARLRRGLCLRYLGRKREMRALKAEIPAKAGALICREDLGGCIRLTRDHLV